MTPIHNAFVAVLFLGATPLWALGGCADDSPQRPPGEQVQATDAWIPGTERGTPPPGDLGAIRDRDTPGDGKVPAGDIYQTDFSLIPGTGHVVYNLPDEHAYIIEAKVGAQPQDLTLAMSKFGAGSEDAPIAISRDGKLLLVESERFHADCQGYACLAVVHSDLSQGQAVISDGDVVHAKGQFTIADGGTHVVYETNEGNHDRDLFVLEPSGGAWGTPRNITAQSTMIWNANPNISYDKSRVVFDCGASAYSQVDTSICEVGMDGTGFRVVITPQDAPPGFSPPSNLRSPDYGPDGSIIFEGDWDGEMIWRLPPGGTVPLQVSASSSDNSPCVLPSGVIVSLYLNRPGGMGYHELKMQKYDGSDVEMLLIDFDVHDTGMHCSH